MAHRVPVAPGGVSADDVPDLVARTPRPGVPARAADLHDRLKREVSELAAIHKPSASDGEREAAERVAQTLADAGARVRVEPARAHGTYWMPLGALSLAGVAASLLARRGRTARALGTVLGGGAAAGVWDDVTGGEHHVRRLLPRRTTYNVVAEMGDADATRTVVLVAHHDAAKSGAIFNPAIAETLARFRAEPTPGTERHSPPVMFPVLAGPALAAAGALTGSKLLAVLGGAMSLFSAAVFADIARSPVVPAANDNISGVVCLQELARRLATLPPKGLRVLLVSTGSEESLMEGMHRFARRHFPDLPVRDTFVLCVDTVGSGKLLVLRGEGMLKLYRYPQPALELIDGLAGQLGIDLEPNVMLRNATDGLYALKAGFPSAMLGSVSENGAPGNYHWPTDTPENVNYETLADAVRLCTALVHRLAQRWPF
ncbi:MAG: hypothetical protein JWO74_1645 [Solirubrobacterales bacterium]|nr:hypothetical protein [Solirubrobacterales bacterium]